MRHGLIPKNTQLRGATWHWRLHADYSREGMRFDVSQTLSRGDCMITSNGKAQCARWAVVSEPNVTARACDPDQGGKKRKTGTSDRVASVPYVRAPLNW